MKIAYFQINDGEPVEFAQIVEESKTFIPFTFDMENVNTEENHYQLMLRDKDNNNVKIFIREK